MTDFGELARAMRRTSEVAAIASVPPRSTENRASIGDEWGIVLSRADGTTKRRIEVVRGEPREGDSR